MVSALLLENGKKWKGKEAQSLNLCFMWLTPLEHCRECLELVATSCHPFLFLKTNETPNFEALFL